MVSVPKLQTGDNVAILSPSAGLPGKFPHVQELGLKRIREKFGLIPVEYPTTRQFGSSLQDRARDLMDAFKNPDIKGIVTSIGGSDQIKLIKYLDPKVFIENPKPYFGFSDNTHVVNFLFKHNIPSYYGGAVMTQFAMQVKMHDLTVEYLKKAFFETGEEELRSSDFYTDEDLEWSNPENLRVPRKLDKNEGWVWNSDESFSGILWGGCLESLDYQLRVNVHLPDIEQLKGKVLFFETSELVPEHNYVKRVLTGMGERGWFDIFAGVLVGRPKAWSPKKLLSIEQKEVYRAEQRQTVLTTIHEYNPSLPMVQNLDFGHTDPQIILPVGKMARIDAENKKIFVEY